MTTNDLPIGRGPIDERIRSSEVELASRRLRSPPLEAVLGGDLTEVLQDNLFPTIELARLCGCAEINLALGRNQVVDASLGLTLRKGLGRCRRRQCGRGREQQCEYFRSHFG